MPFPPDSSTEGQGDPLPQPSPPSGWHALVGLAIIAVVVITIVICTGSIDGVQGIVTLLLLALGVGAVVRSQGPRD